MKRIPKKFTAFGFEFHKITKEEIPSYLVNNSFEILSLRKEEIQAAKGCKELVYKGFVFSPMNYTDANQVLKKFLFKVKQAKLYQHPEETLDTLVYYIGISTLMKH